MPLALLLALQAAAAPAAAIPPIDFDLARYRAPDFGLPDRACDRADPSAIVVCARRGGGAYPLDEMARRYEPHRLMAERRLGRNLVADVHVEQGDYSDRGVVPQRAMARLSLGF